MKITEIVDGLKGRWNRFAEEAKKPAQCIFCAGCKIWWNGKRQRSASILVEGVAVFLSEVLCPRVKCGTSDCHKSWTLRPPGLLPQRHYQLCLAAAGLSEYLFNPASSLGKVAETCECSVRTVRRWVNWTACVTDPQTLERRILESVGNPILAPLRTISDRFQRYCSRKRQQELSRAGQNLCLLEALGQARGCEPPGLRGVLTAVVANRYRLTTYRDPIIPDFAWRSWMESWPIMFL
jgi:hypothetical protein